MPTSSPLVAQLEFSVRIRQRRKELGLDAKTVSSRMGFSRNYYSAVENTRAILADDRLSDLAEILDYDDEAGAELSALLLASRRSGWWDRYAKLMAESTLELWALEDGASEINIYESNVVTGLLQTEDYARAIIRVDPKTSAADEQRLVNARLRRQQRLSDTAPLRVRVLLSEATVMQEIGGPEVLQRQLHHVLDQMEALGTRLELRILPFSATEMIPASTVVLLGFASPFLPKLVWREAGDALAPSEDQELLSVLGLSFDRVWAGGLEHDETVALLEQRCRDLAET